MPFTVMNENNNNNVKIDINKGFGSIDIKQGVFGKYWVSIG